MDLDHLNATVAEFHRGKKWILAPTVAAGVTPAAGQLREWGAAGVMIIAAVEGVGELPNADRIHYTRATGDTVMTSIRAYQDSVERPSALLLGKVEVGQLQRHVTSSFKSSNPGRSFGPSPSPHSRPPSRPCAP